MLGGSDCCRKTFSIQELKRCPVQELKDCTVSSIGRLLPDVQTCTQTCTLKRPQAFFSGCTVTFQRLSPCTYQAPLCPLQESIRGCDVFLIQPSCPPVNDSLMELMVMIDACKRASARSITAVMPYFGYARADRKTQGRESIAAKLTANLLTEAGGSHFKGHGWQLWLSLVQQRVAVVCSGSSVGSCGLLWCVVF